MDGMMEIVRKRYKPKTPTARNDEVATIALSKLPTALGEYVGRVLGQIVAYGEACSWDSAAADGEAFVAEFQTGFKAGLATYRQEYEFPSLAQMCRAWATMAHISGARGIMVEHIDGSRPRSA